MVQDEQFMHRAIELSKLAIAHGNEPFGAVLVPEFFAYRLRNPSAFYKKVIKWPLDTDIIKGVIWDKRFQSWGDEYGSSCQCHCTGL